jgi:hypothetical protein
LLRWVALLLAVGRIALLSLIVVTSGRHLFYEELGSEDLFEKLEGDLGWLLYPSL